ncbi:sigma-54-dependent transcriptional regulator [Desulfosediminicola ganghwensis]|uniref:sigma-54-dependent transcriptional regulator n=1 Tax=Desulfosediminicola ganghwensis TaxID=2569540 RepID=UPI0010AC50BB|nr:sigma-54 dependent transcriptional regulator [Desulfosediminicola ganghwensis]
MDQKSLSCYRRPTQKTLIIDDEETSRFSLNYFLLEEGFEVTLTTSYEEAEIFLSRTEYDIIFVEIAIAGSLGFDFLKKVRESYSDTQVIVVTGSPDIDKALISLKLGVIDFILKPVRLNELLKASRLALRQKHLSGENEYYRSNLETIFRSVRDGIVTVDTSMRIVHLNEAAMVLCGLSDAVGRPISEQAVDCGRGCLGILQDVFTGNEAKQHCYIECQRTHKHNQIVNLSVSPLFENSNGFSGYVMVMRDETKLHQKENLSVDEPELAKLIGENSQMILVKKLIRTLGELRTTVLITGESGTGKELTVDALHSFGKLSDGPLIKVNCGALSENILESELFGHVKGAFTGATTQRDGRFHFADGGTIFLDEIGDITPKTQLQLLRVIETMCFERVGSSTTEKVEVRIIAATNSDLALKVARGEFREDLYYRLKVVQISLPPLRERKDDLPLLTRYFIQQLNCQYNKKIRGMTENAQNFFQKYSWPGNIRELKHCLEHAYIFCKTGMIATSDLPMEIQRESGMDDEGLSQIPIQDNELERLKRALKETGGNKAKASRMLNMSRRTIYRKIVKYNLTN